MGKLVAFKVMIQYGTVQVEFVDAFDRTKIKVKYLVNPRNIIYVSRYLIKIHFLTING